MKAWHGTTDNYRPVNFPNNSNIPKKAKRKRSAGVECYNTQNEMRGIFVNNFLLGDNLQLV